MEWQRAYFHRFLQVFEVFLPGKSEPSVKVMKGHAVAGLVYNPQRDAVAFVRQVRLPFVNENCDGMILEVPAGHVGKAPPQHALAWELKEEMGVQAEREELERQMYHLNKFREVAVSPGWTNEKLWLIFTCLQSGQCDDSRTVFGNAAEGERTELLWVSASELDDMVCEDLKTWGLVQWFLRQREKGNPLCQP